MRIPPLALALCLALPALPAPADETRRTTNGSDTFIAGDTVLEAIGETGDSFVAGHTAILGGEGLGDLHVAGFDVTVRAEVAEDLYAAGATVDIAASVGGDVTAAGYSVTIEPGAAVAGNMRLAGNTVTIEGPVEGALSVMGRNVVLNAAVGGNLQVTAGSLSFGEAARVDGLLNYSTVREAAVPDSVAPAERVRYARLDWDDDWEDFDVFWGEEDMPVFPTAMSLFGAFLVSLLFFVALGALALGFMPERLEAMRASIAAAPGRTFLLGVAGLAVLFGLVPISVMTLVGLPFLPILLLAILVVWTLGYAFGAYTVGMHVWASLGGAAEPGTLARLALLAIAVSVVALLNFIPFVGWVANFTLVLIGIGALTEALLGRFIAAPGTRPDNQTTAVGD